MVETELERPGPYTTITVEEYVKLTRAIRYLRAQVQKARQFTEKGQFVEALDVLREEKE